MVSKKILDGINFSMFFRLNFFSYGIIYKFVA